MTIQNIEDVMTRIMSLNRHLTEQSLTTLLSASGWDKEDIEEGVRVFRNSQTNLNPPINPSNNFPNNSSATEISQKVSPEIPLAATATSNLQNPISTENNLENKIPINVINNSLNSSSESFKNSDLISSNNIPPSPNQNINPNPDIVENKNSHSVVIIIVIIILLVFVGLGAYLYLNNTDSQNFDSNYADNNSSSDVIGSDSNADLNDEPNVSGTDTGEASEVNVDLPEENISTSSIPSALSSASSTIVGTSTINSKLNNISTNTEINIKASTNKTPAKNLINVSTTISDISEQIATKMAELKSIAVRILTLQKEIDDLKTELQRLSGMKGGSVR